LKKEEIQAELKNLSEKIFLLSKQVANIKEEKDISDNDIDFDKIEKIGKKYPIERHYMSGKDEYKQGLYMNMLMAVANIDAERIVGRMIFAERLRRGLNYRINIKDTQKTALLVDDEIIDNFVKSLDEVGKISFIIDCFIMCEGLNNCSDELKKYIAEICTLFEFDNKKLKEIINVSKVMLTQKLDVFKWDFDFDYDVFAKNFRYYMPVKELEKYRKKIFSCGGYENLALSFYKLSKKKSKYRKGEEIEFIPVERTIFPTKKNQIRQVDRNGKLWVKEEVIEKGIHWYDYYYIIHILDYIED